MNLQTEIKDALKNNVAVVYSKSYCPHCTATKELLASKGIEPKVYELDQMGEDGARLQGMLEQMTR